MKNILKSFLRIIFFPLLWVYFAFKYTGTVRKSKKYVYDQENGGTFEERCAKVTKLIKLYLFLNGIEVIASFDGEWPKNKPVFFIPNHKSVFDPLVIVSAVANERKKKETIPPLTFVSKIELKEKTYGKIASYVDCVFIDRQNVRQAFQCMKEQSELIKKNISICVFPEGTRVHGDELGEFKSASIKVALKNFVPVIPVAIYGSDNLEKKKSLYRFFFGFHQVYIHFGNPMDTFQYADANSDFVMNNLKNKICIMYNDLSKRAKH